MLNLLRTIRALAEFALFYEFVRVQLNNFSRFSSQVLSSGATKHHISLNEVFLYEFKDEVSRNW